jgi:HK97 family phage major capsid protein
MKSPELYAKLQKLHEEKKKIGDEAAKLGTKQERMSAEDNTKFDAFLADIQAKHDEIQRLEKLSLLQDADQKYKRTHDASGNPIKLGGTPEPEEQAAIEAAKWKIAPITRLPDDSEETFKRRQLRNTKEYAEAYADAMILGKGAPTTAQSRNLFAQQDISGGNLVLPQMLSDRLLKLVDNYLWMMDSATIFRVPRAMSLGVPTLDNNPDDGDWTTEIAPITADVSMTFGKRVLQPTPIRKRLLASERFLRLAMDTTYWSADAANGNGGSPENIVYERLAYKLAVTLEKACYTGNGTNKPLGIYVASPNGISTARDIVTGSATNFTYDGLINAKYNLKVQYQRRAQWDLHRNALALILKLKDSNGRQLLNFSTVQGRLDTLLECPVRLSEYTPNTYTTGQYVGMIGDFSFYAIALAQEITLKAAYELYAETGNVGIFCGMEADGMPMLEEAFSRMITS